ncbi:hypothetical protein SETIT_2G110000v2 [Setaria italica]|uniref:Ubiquitin-like protease family profile domain-containing protein n=1 Tax=Setaria italica TaxID=4555 RepID=K4A0H9_SETIT|nr:hypothetical protein SETIT_2G110000v2 [Setaria italica]
MDVILFATLLREIETLDDDVVPCGDDTVDAKDIVTRENLEITIRVDASDAIATNQEIKAKDDVLESEDGNNLLDRINRVDALENAVDLELEDPKVSRHNKPKKVHMKEVQPQEQHVVVRVDDIFINFKTFKCLLCEWRCEYFIHVINAYINLIRAEKHLLCRAESTIYLENTLIVGLLQRDGTNKEKIKPNIKENSIVERVMKYMAHDLVFLPINIEEMHWYLAMVNCKRREIQVLDSLGPMSCDDLGHVLDGLQLQIDAVLGVRDITDHKRPDLQVFSWPVVEQFYHRMQTDGVSCGLFLLNFMEYWTDEKLSDTFTSDPYPISLSLKNLQDILDVNRSMDVDVFNLAVRMLACDMATVLREPKSHFMDLTFSKIARTYDHAMDEIDPSWNDDIYDWKHIYPCLVPKTFYR